MPTVLPHPDRGNGTADLLRRTTEHYDRALDLYEALLARIAAGEDVPWGDAEKTARAVHAATQTLLNLRERIDDERGRHAGLARGYALDLDEARATVRRLLDRLRSAGTTG